MHLDTHSDMRIINERIARLKSDYDSTPSSGSRTVPRLVVLTIIVAIAGALVAASAQAARVAPSFRPNGGPASRVLVRMQATVPAFRPNFRLGVRSVRVLSASTCDKLPKQLCKPAS